MKLDFLMKVVLMNLYFTLGVGRGEGGLRGGGGGGWEGRGLRRTKSGGTHKGAVPKGGHRSVPNPEKVGNTAPGWRAVRCAHRYGPLTTLSSSLNLVTHVCRELVSIVEEVLSNAIATWMFAQRAAHIGKRLHPGMHKKPLESTQVPGQLGARPG